MRQHVLDNLNVSNITEFTKTYLNSQYLEPT